MRGLWLSCCASSLLAGCCLPFGGSSPTPPSTAPAKGQPTAPALAPGVPGAPGVAPVAQLQPGGTTVVPAGVQVAVGVAQAGATVPPPPPGADARAAARMTEYTVQKIALGYVPHGAPGADTLGRGDSRSYTITLTAGDCYTIAAFGGAGVRDLDIYLVSPAGRELARDVALDSRPIANTCVQESGTYRVRILMYDGRGPYTYQVYRNPGAAAQATGIAGLDPTVRRRMDQFTARNVARGFRAIPGLAGAGVLGRNASQEFTVNVAAGGSCYAFVGFGGSGLPDLDIYLFDPSGSQVRRDIAIDPVADVKHFVVMPGAYRMRLHAYRGSGAFAYQVYQRAGQVCN